MKWDGIALNWRGVGTFLKWALMISILGMFLWWGVFVSGIFIIKGYQVSANEDRKGVCDENFKRFYLGRNLYSVSLEEGEQALKSDTSIKTVAIQRKLPNQIRYVIQYRQAVASVVSDRMLLFLDDEGFVIRTDSVASSSELTRITGLPVDRYNSGKPLESSKRARLELALQIAQLLQQAPFGKSAIIDVSGSNLEIQLKDGFRGTFSYGAPAEERFNRFATVYEDLQKKGVAKGLIDVSQNGYPVYKPFGE